VEYQEELAASLTAVGRNYEADRQYEAAQQTLERAVAIHERLLRMRADDRECRFRLAVTLNHLGLVYLRGQGRVAEGVAGLERAVAICKQLMVEAPEVPDYPNQLARTLTSLGQEGNLNGDLAKSVVVNAEAVALLEKLVAAHPRVADYQLRLTLALANLAIGQTNLRQPERARGPAARAVAVAEGLVKAHPNVPEYQRELAYARVNYGVALGQLGQHTEAASLVEAAVVTTGLGGALYNGACAYAYCSTTVGRDTKLLAAERDRLAVKYCDRAMELLKEAEKSGIFKSAQAVSAFQTDHDLDPLRQREDFKQLLAHVRGQPAKDK
jgi:tetratricopeptide (TPR) repeat protein